MNIYSWLGGIITDNECSRNEEDHTSHMSLINQISEMIHRDPGCLDGKKKGSGLEGVCGMRMRRGGWADWRAQNLGRHEVELVKCYAVHRTKGVRVGDKERPC